MEIRKLKYEEIDLMKEVMQTRDSLMLSKDNALTSYRFLEDENNFNRCMSVGYFDDDGLLDAFIFHNIWEELPAYSSLVFTRKRENRVKILENNNTDANLKALWTYTNEEMGKINIFQYYQLNPLVGWRDMAANKEKGKSVRRIVEIIPAGEMSKFPIFRLRLANKRYEMDMKITHWIRLPENWVLTDAEPTN